MANSKISALTFATTVAGTEVLPIVQSSATVKVSVANLTPGLDTITAAKGGTGQTSYVVGDLLYANTTTTLAKLADVATGNALISGGISTAPSWGKIGLTTHISGVLPVANGGTNASSASITAFNNITGYTASGATGTTSTNLVFSTSPSITTPTLVGDATLSTGNLVIGTSGKGIDFSATAGTGTSELLADYEEGDWTPTFTGSTTDPTVTYSVQVGRYTKVGRTVTVSCRINLSAATGGSGNLRVSGLPFATLNVGNAVQTTAYAYKVAWTTLGPEAGYATNNSTDVFLFAGTATGITSITTANLSATSQLIFNFTYQAN
jgi:hypothetical protein